MGASELRNSGVFPLSQQQLLGHGKIRYATMRGGFPFDGGCVPPAGWAEAGGANQPPGMSVMSFRTTMKQGLSPWIMVVAEVRSP